MTVKEPTKAKMEMRNIIVGGNVVKTRKVRICNVCGGHAPVTKKVAEGECQGHTGVKSYFLSLGNSHPQ